MHKAMSFKEIQILFWESKNTLPIPKKVTVTLILQQHDQQS